MAIKELNIKEQHYADTREEAEKIINDAKEDVYLTSQKITEKHNKYGTYFIVDLVFTYNTPKEVMESAANGPAPEPTNKGVEYTKDEEGSISIAPGQVSMDELENESEDEE